MRLTNAQTQQITLYLQQQGALAAWLYGSYANGTASEHSDIDLAVLLPENLDPWQILPQFDSELSQRLEADVHCISIISVPTPLAFEAVEGQRLLDTADALFMEQRIWSKWEDWNYFKDMA